MEAGTGQDDILIVFHQIDYPLKFLLRKHVLVRINLTMFKPSLLKYGKMTQAFSSDSSPPQSHVCVVRIPAKNAYGRKAHGDGQESHKGTPFVFQYVAECNPHPFNHLFLLPLQFSRPPAESDAPLDSGAADRG